MALTDLEKELQEMFDCTGACDLQKNLEEHTEEDQLRVLWNAIQEDKHQVIDYIIGLGVNLLSKIEGYSLLFAAARVGNIEFAKKLIALGAEIDPRCSQLTTPFLQAANFAQFKMLKWLIQEGADIHATDPRGCNAIHFITTKPTTDPDVVYSVGNYLLDLGIEFDKQEESYQMTPIGFTLIHGFTKFAKRLIEMGANINQSDGKGFTLLHSAAFYSREDLAKIFIEKGVPIDSRNKELQTPLDLAAERGHIKLAQLLLENGANIEARNSDQMTPLHSACRGDHRQMTSFLINAGADIEAKDKWHRSILFWAIESNNLDLFQFLLEMGADINGADISGMTPLLVAGSTANNTIAFILIEKGADIFAKTISGHTLLHIASGFFFERSSSMPPLEDLALWLTDRGLDVNAKANNGDTPLHLAANKGAHQLLASYIEKGGNFKALGHDQKSLLHSAAYGGKYHTCLYLIKLGLPVDVPDESDFTPLMYASSRGYKDLTLDLLDYDVVIDPPQIELGSILFDAAKFGWIDVAQKLIEKGANVNRLTMERKTPYDFAVHYGRIELAELLKNYGGKTSEELLT